MKISEIKPIIDELYTKIINGEIKDLEIVIPNNKNCFGQTSHTKIKELNKGFDWNNELLFIIPINKMTEIN